MESMNNVPLEVSVIEDSACSFAETAKNCEKACRWQGRDNVIKGARQTLREIHRTIGTWVKDEWGGEIDHYDRVISGIPLRLFFNENHFFSMETELLPYMRFQISMLGLILRMYDHFLRACSSIENITTLHMRMKQWASSVFMFSSFLLTPYDSVSNLKYVTLDSIIRTHLLSFNGGS